MWFRQSKGRVEGMCLRQSVLETTLVLEWDTVTRRGRKLPLTDKRFSKSTERVRSSNGNGLSTRTVSR